MASDGNWYPPESHPQAAPTEAVPPVSEPTVTMSEPTAVLPPQQPPVPPMVPPGPPSPPQPPVPPTTAVGPPPVPQPPLGASPGSKSKLPLILGIVGVLLVGAIVAAVVVMGGDDDKKKVADRPAKTSDRDKTATTEDDSDTDSGGPKIVGGEGSSGLNRVISAAIVDLERFWTDEYPEVFDGEKYEPVSGGFFSVSPDDDLPPCATAEADIAGNAFYCGKEDVVAWDDTGLMPKIQDEYGDLGVVVVIAHEWGHAIQARAKMEGATVTIEHQADCYAGAYVGDLAEQDDPAFRITDVTVDAALAGFLLLRDTPGTVASDPSAHGSAFDRVNAFQDGIDNGAKSCAGYTDDSITLVEIPFNDEADAASGGNMPFEDSITTAVTDLEDYWATVYPDPNVGNAAWQPLANVIPVDGENPPCGTDDTSGYLLYYCVADDTIVFDTATMATIHEQIGDFAVGSLIATQYGLAVQARLDALGDDPLEQNLTADCLAGAWTASVLLQNRTTSQLLISPGDLDETVQALLTFGSTASEANASQGTGFQRVQAFRAGVIDGLAGCAGD